jgi:hypothetical protein
LYFFWFEWHVNSCAMIFSVFNTSIHVIVTVLPFFSNFFQKLCNMFICVIVTVFAFMLSSCDSQIFHALIFLLLKPPWCFIGSYPFHSPSLGSNFWNHQGSNVHLSTLSYMGVSSK